MKTTPRHCNTKRNKNTSISPLNRNKENLPSQRKEKQVDSSIKMCIQLANHHQKEAEELKVKNDVLEYRLHEQIEDMRMLRKELEAIKSDLQHTQATSKELQCLREENALLRSQLEELTNKVRSQNKTGESNASFGINPLTHARQSRRQKYAKDYESISFVASTVCLTCKQREEEVKEERERYCNELRQLQLQVSELQRIQLMVGVMEQQLSDKNVCIDYLRGELDCFEDSLRGVLDVVNLLEERQAELTIENGRLREVVMKQSYSRTVA